MRYSPYETEYQASSSLSEAEALEYFLMRVYETEEVWAAKSGGDWFYQIHDGKSYFNLWPYYQYAQEYLSETHPQYRPDAMSLEDFLYDVLDSLLDEDVLIEIMPTATKRGCYITPERLFSIVEGMLDAGEYRFDG